MLLGVGPDGHTASPFPGTTAARETVRWVVGVSQAAVAPFVPRVSLTLPCLSLTHEMVFLAAGAEKKAIIERVFSGEDLPAARAFASAGETIWMLDQAAAPPNARSMATDRNSTLSGIAAIIIMGVSGAGKSTIGEALAARLGFAYEDADAYHSKANIEPHGQCPLWVKSRRRKKRCPLYPQKRTCAVQKQMSALGQKQT